MNLDDPQAADDAAHPRSDLEQSVIDRIREWTDLIPWLRLARTMRTSASPPMVLTTAATYWVWSIGLWLWRVDTGSEEAWMLGRVLVNISASDGFVIFLWSTLVWAPVGLLLMRQGGLLTANRSMLGIQQASSIALRRTPAAWMIAIIPFACSLAFALLLVLVGWISHLAEEIYPLQAILALVAALLALPCGVLIFGAVASVPLGWAALANERDPDPLDSLSRGYEALYRRPLRLILYASLSGLITSILYALAHGITLAASATAWLILGSIANSPGFAQLTTRILGVFPVVVCITAGCSLIGGSYLLLRYDTGGQEVEDIWQPAPSTPTSLPDLPP